MPPKRRSHPGAKLLWGGRFQDLPDEAFIRFSSSLPHDGRLFPFELRQNEVQAEALFRLGVLSRKEHQQTRRALRRLKAEGPPPPDALEEDIHSYIEQRLLEMAGEAAAKIRLGRSRNDQVLTSLRLYLKEAAASLREGIRLWQQALYQKAKAHRQTLYPSMTHTRQAQPSVLAHYFLSYLFGLERDKRRLVRVVEAADVLPLGSCSLNGTRVPLPQEAMAQALGFRHMVANSLDMVGDRDPVLEWLFGLALLQVRMSRFAQDLILFSGEEGFLVLPERYCTGSSAMPHKKNPDAAELVRGRSGRVLAALTGALTLMKGLPASYQRDLQEDKALAFAAEDLAREHLEVVTGLTQGLTVDIEKAAALLHPFSLALDAAEIVSLQGVPFRAAHEAVGQVVQSCEANPAAFPAELADRLGRRFPHLDLSEIKALDFAAAANGRRTRGGSGNRQISRQLAAARRLCS